MQSKLAGLGRDGSVVVHDVLLLCMTHCVALSAVHWWLGSSMVDAY